MKTLTLQQGSPEWAAHRARSLNASELSAAMGLSSYITRSALVKQKATGIAPEIDAATQHRFNKGHEFEAIARPWAEEIIGEELFPVVLAGEVDALPLSASLDGQTLTGDVTWEHKSGNATLLARLDAGVIPDEYHPQMEQGLLLSGATRCLFMASSGDREAMRYAWYESNPELRAKIVPTWRQFQADVAAYVPTEPAAPVMAAPIESLPAVVVQVQGALTVGGNLDAFGQALRSFIERIPARPATDIEFANCEAACKALKRAEDALTQAEDGALAQISDVELMRRTVADLKELARSTRLATEKLVKAEKDARRTEKVMAARQAFDKHVAACQLDIKGVRLIVPMPDFGGAIKGLSSLASIDDKLTAALIAGKAETNTLAGRIANNLKTLDSVPQFAHLFADRQELAYKDAETLELLMQKRVDAEAARLEAERQRIQAEAERKAKEAAERQSVQPTALHGPHGTVAYQADGMPAEGRAKFDHDPRFAAVVAGAPAPQVDEPATLKLGDVNARLAPIHVTADGLRSIGIEPAGREKNATLYRESQFAEICQVLVLHLQSVVQPSEATA